METVYLHTGSNLADRPANLREANRLIGAGIGRILRHSRVYVTEAWGITDQPDFLNQALALETDLTPPAVLACIHRIEKAMGRRREIKWGARLIDIDILFFGQQIIATAQLNIPHPELPHRNFVLRPLAEIAPELRHPKLGRTVSELLAASEDPLEAEVLLDEN